MDSMPAPALGRPGTRSVVLRQDVAQSAARQLAIAERIATDLLNTGLDRHALQSVLHHVRGFVDAHLDTKDGRKQHG